MADLLSFVVKRDDSRFLPEKCNIPYPIQVEWGKGFEGRVVSRRIPWG
jgi:hypothetical protein